MMGKPAEGSDLHVGTLNTRRMGQGPSGGGTHRVEPRCWLAGSVLGMEVAYMTDIQQFLSMAAGKLGAPESNTRSATAGLLGFVQVRADGADFSQLPSRSEQRAVAPRILGRSISAD